MRTSLKPNCSTDIIEAMIEINEHEMGCRCRYCHQMETLSFVGTRLSSGLLKWQQLPDGTVVHLCESRRLFEQGY